MREREGRRWERRERKIFMSVRTFPHTLAKIDLDEHIHSRIN